MSVFYNRYGIRLTKDKYQQSFNFKFEFVFINQVLKQINEVDCNKSSGGNILEKTFQMTKEELTFPITNCINKCISASTFPDERKITVSEKLAIDQLVYYQCITIH